MKQHQALKPLLLAAALMVGIPAFGQTTYTPVTLYDSTGTPYPTGSGTAITPIPEGVICYTTAGGGGAVPCTFSGGGGSNAFSALTSSTNTTAAMLVGTGASLGVTGTGTIGATSVTGLSVTAAKTLSVSNSLTLAGTDATTMTFPATSTTVAGLGIVQTFSAAQTISAAGAASTAPLMFTGALFTGGNGTTTFPYLMLQPSTATAETGWVTTGTFLGVNAATGFVGDFLDFHVNNVASVFTVTAAGAVTGTSYTAGVASGLGNTGTTALRLSSGSQFSWSGSAGFNGTQDTTECRASAGMVEIGASTTCATTGSITALGIIGGSFQQQAASNTGGTCPMSGTSCTITIGHTYTTPVCIATQQSGTLTGASVGCTVSGTTVTITAQTTNTETWGAFVFGNPS